METMDISTTLDRYAPTQPSQPSDETSDLAAPCEGDDLMTARYRADLCEAREAHERAFAAQMEAESRYRAAQEAQALRAQALQEAEQQAQAAALRSLSEGTPAARRTERAADGHAQRLRRDLARADTAITSLAADVTAAQTATRLAGEALARADYTLQVALLTDRQIQRRAETDALLAHLAQIVAEGRADNAAAAKLTQDTSRTTGGFLSERAARQTSSGQLYLPGEDAARTAGTQGREMGNALAERGFAVLFAPDVCLAEVPEDQGRSIAERKGADLAAYYQGWML